MLKCSAFVKWYSAATFPCVSRTPTLHIPLRRGIHHSTSCVCVRPPTSAFTPKKYCLQIHVTSIPCISNLKISNVTILRQYFMFIAIRLFYLKLVCFVGLSYSVRSMRKRFLLSLEYWNTAYKHYAEQLNTRPRHIRHTERWLNPINKIVDDWLFSVLSWEKSIELNWYLFNLLHKL